MFFEVWQLIILLGAIAALAVYTQRSSYRNGYTRGFMIGQQVGLITSLQACISDKLISIDEKGLPTRYAKKHESRGIMNLSKDLLPSGMQVTAIPAGRSNTAPTNTNNKDR